MGRFKYPRDVCLKVLADFILIIDAPPLTPPYCYLLPKYVTVPSHQFFTLIAPNLVLPKLILVPSDAFFNNVTLGFSELEKKMRLIPEWEVHPAHPPLNCPSVA